MFYTFLNVFEVEIVIFDGFLLQDAIKLCKDWSSDKTLFIPSHENEFGHRVQQRESYWEDFNRKDRYVNPEYEYLPMVLLDIGESLMLKK